MTAPRWTPEMKRAALALISEAEQMVKAMDEFNEDEIMDEYQRWAAEHPEEARRLHERTVAQVEAILARARAHRD